MLKLCQCAKRTMVLLCGQRKHKVVRGRRTEFWKPVVITHIYPVFYPVITWLQNNCQFREKAQGYRNLCFLETACLPGVVCDSPSIFCFALALISACNIWSQCITIIVSYFSYDKYIHYLYFISIWPVTHKNVSIKFRKKMWFTKAIWLYTEAQVSYNRWAEAAFCGLSNQ